LAVDGSGRYDRVLAEDEEQELPMIKTILVPATGNETDVATFSAALEVVRPFAAHLDVLHVRLDPVDIVVSMTADGGGGALAPGLIEQLEQDVREREAKSQQMFVEFCARESLPIAAAPPEGTARPSAQWHVETGQEPLWMASYGMTADLIVASRGNSDDAAARSILEAVLLQAGRPLLIPAARALPSAMLVERIAIAWKPTPQAAHAIASALPFLSRAKEIVVITVEEEEGRRDDAYRLMQSLSWHGFAATLERLKPGRGGAAETLLAAAGAEAGLLVMGGYGHSRLRELVFGGFTQRALAGAPLPVLIAH
jgi:nucleotide-binding universal stress UspA family protein